ncbi:2-hydroxyacid dehydrogenase [Marinomonas posidonica]|uniref:Hydroxypyruvate reductase n=1 Tax=Marinomonas posidonica (strain CECT 7376 / NCIMB 14433 / IVIA-Po-181) TaxID=491952 RepID=F6CXX9_MARPP|nr:glyoxylate/hydroxypyruvate reductase A [Marinomonas posidonica]AEF54541.1 Hydroxypyruvate reductase [Marinomonas posidonica IVIA-Po-181]
MSPAILFATNSPTYSTTLMNLCRELYPQVEAFLPGDEGAERAQLAACWAPDPALLKHYPNIQLIHSVAAGVDHIGTDLLSSGVPICRVVDDGQKVGMFEYILCGVLRVQRNFDKAAMEQASQHWQRYPMRKRADMRIGVLGLGELGGYAASQLAEFGYCVSGWARTEKSLAGVRCYNGIDGLQKLLNQSDILVNMLPLNGQTKGILNADLLSQLPEGAYLINCGRGAHLVENDLIEAVNSQHLRGALLDVFSVEPLPSSDPLWTTKDIFITPHIASDASKPEIIHQLVRNAIKLSTGEALNNQINPMLGY